MSLPEQNEQNLFWSALFQETDLSSKLMCQDPSVQLIEHNFALASFGEVHITAKPAVPLGTNFMSDVFIITASAQSKEFSSFVKVLPSNPSRVAAGFIGGSYHREYAVYEQWLDELTSLRSSHGLDQTDIPLNVARSNYVKLSLSKDGTSLLNDTVFALEELKSKGYRMSPQAKGIEGIDLAHAELAMKTYANYHALSIANMRKYKKEDGSYSFPDIFEVFMKDPNYIHPAGVYGTIVLPSYVKILRHLEKNETADWLEGLIPQLGDIWDWNHHLKSKPLTCIIHGDSWSNNILYRYPSEGTPDQMLLIDWQISRCSHPYIDLAYFFFSSTSSEFRKKHFDELVDKYFGVLCSALTKLDIHLDKEGYGHEEFKKEVKERHILGLFMALFILPILLDSAKASEHTLKSEDISKDVKGAEEQQKEGTTEEDLDEEKTKGGWEKLFELESVIANPVLKKRVIELLVDVHKMVS